MTSELKLYRLEAKKNIHEGIQKRTDCKGYFFWYTDTTEYVVAASSEQEARTILSEQKTYSKFDKFNYAHWKFPELTSCEEIQVTEPGIISNQCGTG